MHYLLLSYILFMPFIEIHPPLVVCPWEGLVSCGCWYLINLLQPVASVSQTVKSYTWVMVSRETLQEPGTPHCLGGGKQAGQRRAKQNHNLASPQQTAHLLSASIWGTAYSSSIQILKMANTQQHKHTQAHTPWCTHTGFSAKIQTTIPFLI